MTLPFPDTIEIDGQEYTVDLSADLDINEGDLSSEFCKHAEKFAFYATAYELALRQDKKLHAKLDRQYAILDHSVRMEGKSSGTKLTEKMVENSVITRPEYTELQEKLQEASEKTGLLKQDKDAMIHRRDMLIQLGATQRAEGASDIAMKATAAKRYQS